MKKRSLLTLCGLFILALGSCRPHGLSATYRGHNARDYHGRHNPNPHPAHQRGCKHPEQIHVLR